MRFQWLANISLAALACGALTGCGMTDGYLAATTAPHLEQSHAEHGQMIQDGEAPVPVGEQIVTLPLASKDLICPVVEVREGGAALRVGGPSNDSVRYQLQVSDTARECDPAGPGQVAIKVGVNGNLLIGPAGTPGSYTGDLRISVRDDTSQKTAFEQSYKVSATTDATGQGSFEVVTDPIALPVKSYDVADQYSIFVGFGGGRDVVQRKSKTKKAALTSPAQ